MSPKIVKILIIFRNTSNFLYFEINIKFNFEGVIQIKTIVYDKKFNKILNTSNLLN
jgi:hypothetical protein